MVNYGIGCDWLLLAQSGYYKDIIVFQIPHICRLHQPKVVTFEILSLPNLM